MTPLGCAHRWGHGRPSRQPPDALLTEPERRGEEQPSGWATPLLCLDCGVLWPGEPLPGARHSAPRTILSAGTGVAR
jgi:hypothetical protein